MLVYKQHKFIPTSCFGETEYFIEDVREVMDAQLAPLAPPTQLAPSTAQGTLAAPN